MRECACKLARIAALKREALPERYQECSLGSYVPVCESQRLAIAAIRANPGSGFFIHGNYRSGKTHLAAAQYLALVSTHQCCVWRSIQELLAELRDAEVHDEMSPVLHRAKYAKQFHLFVDDIDKYKPTEWTAAALHDLFDMLYRRKLKCTITTNYPIDVLCDKIDGAVVRRIEDMCTVLEV